MRVLLVRFTLVGVSVLYRPISECRSVVCEFDGRFVLSWPFVVLFFVWLVSMLLIVTLVVMISLFVVLMLLTLLYPLF